MTLIIGIKCEDGAVIASDGAATFEMGGMPTIRQQVRRKLSIIGGQLVIGTSGPVGLGQRFYGELSAMWIGKQLAGAGLTNALLEIRKAFWKHIAFELDVAKSFAPALGPASLQRALTSTVLAIPLSGQLCLCQFDELGAPEQATDDLPFISIGSGQLIADPFLAFVRRIFWPDRLPTVSEGILAAVWTLHHAIETNAGGVANPMQVVTVTKDGQKFVVKELDDNELEGENHQAIIRAEKKIATSFDAAGEAQPDPPSPPAAAPQDGA